MDMHSAVSSIVRGSELGMVCMRPLMFWQKSQMSSMHKSCVFFSSCNGIVEYLQECMAKKSAPTRSWPMAVLRGVDVSLYIAFQTKSGRHA